VTASVNTMGDSNVSDINDSDTMSGDAEALGIVRRISVTRSIHKHIPHCQ